MLRTLGASRGQILTSVVVEALAIGAAGCARRPRRRVRHRAGAQRPLRGRRDRPADDRPGDRDPHDRSSRCWSASSSPSSPRWCRRCARPGCRRSRRCRRSSLPAQPPPRARLRWRSRCCSASPAWRWSSSASSATPAAGTAAGLMGGGAVAIVLGVSLLQPQPGAAAGGARRLAAGAAPPADRPPRAREHAAQPEPHRGHRGGADDRPRAGRLRHRLRRRAEELGRLRGRRKLRRASW